MNKVISETEGTGKKIQTFVSANGVTLAVQSFDSSQNAQVNFIHQDPSGSSVQQTKADGTLTNPYHRMGEYDAFGRNVANSSPYITLNTEPPASNNGSSINLLFVEMRVAEPMALQE